jgi:hypothetical protein
VFGTTLLLLSKTQALCTIEALESWRRRRVQMKMPPAGNCSRGIQADNHPTPSSHCDVFYPTPFQSIFTIPILGNKVEPNHRCGFSTNFNAIYVRSGCHPTLFHEDILCMTSSRIQGQSAIEQKDNASIGSRLNRRKRRYRIGSIH